MCETISCSQICKINVFSPHGQSVGLAAATASGLQSPPTISHQLRGWDKEAMESSSSSSSWAAQYHLQLLPQFLHYKCTNYYRAAEGSVTSRCVVCSVTGSSGVTQLLAAVWCQCQCSLESLCPARRLLQLHRGRSVAREEALDTGACGFHIRWCVSLWIFIQYTVIWRVCLLSFVTNLLMLSPSNFPQYILLWRY